MAFTATSWPAANRLPLSARNHLVYLRRQRLVTCDRTSHATSCRKADACSRNSGAISATAARSLQNQEDQVHFPSSEGCTLPQRIVSGRAKQLLTIAACCVAAFLVLGAFPATASEAASGSFSFSGALRGLISFVLHLDVHLSQIIAKYGSATYALLFAIVFCETGLVITPFLPGPITIILAWLATWFGNCNKRVDVISRMWPAYFPGDSLLFAAGAFAALGHLSVTALLVTFITSAVLGDALNYQLGKAFGVRAANSKLVKREYIEKTEAFYLKHGGKTVVLARFIPIVRTFAPFVAGVGTMPYGRFAAYNVGGAVLWTVLFVSAGLFLGNLPAVKHNFSIVVFAIVGVSLLPLLFEAIAARREGKLATASVEGKIAGNKIAAAEETKQNEGLA